MTPFHGAKAKIARARHHIQVLEHLIADHLTMRPVEVVIAANFAVGESKEVRMTSFTKIGHPDEFSTVFGDAVHNLRSSLDVAMNDAVAVVSGKAPVGVYFPFSNTEGDLPNAIARKMKGATIDLMKIVKSCAHTTAAIWRFVASMT